MVAIETEKGAGVKEKTREKPPGGTEVFDGTAVP